VSVPSTMPSARLAWVGFGLFVAANAAWLYHDIQSGGSDRRDADAYAECRKAVRNAKEKALRVPFPTADLVRVTRRDANHFRVRGFVDPGDGSRPIWYRCHLTSAAERWRVDSVVFDR
jgi:hypothetical protein